MSIEFKNVSYIYNQDTPLEHKALDNVSFKVEQNKFIAIIGHTGSGKSTLMQHLNALLKPTEGMIKILNQSITNSTPDKSLKELRKNVSLVFQFPESQLFETTVIDDIAFGPKNFGYSEAEAKKLAFTWLKKVGLSEKIAQRSPFDLSGGQMRRVAIAGVMAYQPRILCLDEPAAGLDPIAKDQMMALFKQYQESGHTVILISHNMDDVAKYADEVLVLEDGKLIKQDTPQNIFSDQNWVRKHSLEEPTASLFASQLTNYDFNSRPLTTNDLVNEIKVNLKR